jgi:hypothetical protein
MSTHRYTLTRKKHNSTVYGNCEFCGNHADTLYHQSEQRRYTRSDGSQGFTQANCSDKFGHLACLESIRHTASTGNEVKAA